MTADRHADAAARDAANPLAAHRARFLIADPEIIYLDGNSLGRLPLRTREVVQHAVDEEWGRGLVRSWRHWIGVASAAGDRLGSLIGAAPGQVILTDQTSVDLYKAAVAALDAQAPDRDIVVTDTENFPSDRYVLAGAARRHDAELVVVDADPVAGLDVAALRKALDAHAGRVALVALTHVAYRTGARYDLAAITAAAHETGALMLWDLSHSVGAVPVDVDHHRVDLAVGCTYKHLCGGPGAPAFIYVNATLQDRLRSPIEGWWGHRDPFAFSPDYVPAPGVRRFAAGTPPMLSMQAAAVGIEEVAAAGIEAIRAVSLEQTGFLLTHLADVLDDDATIASPREPSRRGAHVAIRHPHAWQVCQALEAAGVITDFRTPDIVRLGPAPLTTTFAELATALDRLEAIMTKGSYRAFPASRGEVT